MAKSFCLKSITQKKWRSRTSRRHCQRRLLGEVLESRQLLTVALWEAEGESCGPVTDPSGTAAAEETSTATTGSGSPTTFGPLALNAANPTVVQVIVPSPPVKSLAVVFSDDMNVPALIGDGSIANAVTLVSYASGPVSLQASQFTYEASTRTLTLSLARPLVGGNYELRLDGSQLLNGASLPLQGGRDGLGFGIPTFAAATMLQAGGADLKVDNYSVPSLADWNDDGLLDLIVGEKTAAGTGKIRVYVNSGSNQTPVYDSFVFAGTNDGNDLNVPASGCLGVYPRVLDWNQDGKKDLVLGLADGIVEVALNTNTDAAPRFATPTRVQVGAPGAKSDLDVGDRATPVLVDWNNDGRTDLVVGGLDGKVHILLNSAASGVPDFRTDTLVMDGTSQLAVPTGRSSLAVVDLNGDGRKDLVSGNTEGQLLFFANVGSDATPQFSGFQLLQANGAVIDLPGTPRSRPFVADFNGDGVPDLLVGAADGLVRLYAGSRNSGTGTSSTVGSPGGTYAYAFRVEPPTYPWRNPRFPLDVNDDGFITPLDVLLVINYLNAHGPGTLPTPTLESDSPPPYVDTTGDGDVTPLDVLLVVNDLNANGTHGVTAGSGTDCTTTPTCKPAGEAEGEDVLAAIASDVLQVFEGANGRVGSG